MQGFYRTPESDTLHRRIRIQGLALEICVGCARELRGFYRGFPGNLPGFTEGLPDSGDSNPLDPYSKATSERKYTFIIFPGAAAGGAEQAMIESARLSLSHAKENSPGCDQVDRDSGDTL